MKTGTRTILVTVSAFATFRFETRRVCTRDTLSFTSPLSTVLSVL